MGGAVSSGRDNGELIDNLTGGKYIRTRAVERVFRALDRADYMTPEARDQAYKDLAWRNGLLHMSAPCIYSEVMEGLELKPGLSFLNIGSGTGYLSTLVGLITGSGGINHGVEVHQSVVDYATKKLSQFLENSPTLDEFDFCEPKFYCGNGLCLSLSAPYDRVYCGAGCPEEYQNYFKQLIKIGGILVMPLNDNLLQVRRVGEAEWRTRSLLSVSFATLRPPAADDNNLLKLEEQTPARLQVLSRGAVRSAMRASLVSRHAELRAPPPRAPPPTKRHAPRRICIPLDDDADENLNGLHDLDPASGANEMNALLSLVLSMGHNRVAGALRFDSPHSSRSSRSSRSSEHSGPSEQSEPSEQSGPSEQSEQSGEQESPRPRPVFRARPDEDSSEDEDPYSVGRGGYTSFDGVATLEPVRSSDRSPRGAGARLGPRARSLIRFEFHDGAPAPAPPAPDHKLQTEVEVYLDDLSQEEPSTSTAMEWEKTETQTETKAETKTETNTETTEDITEKTEDITEKPEDITEDNTEDKSEESTVKEDKEESKIKEEKRQHSTDEESTASLSKSKEEKRQKLDSGIGEENTPTSSASQKSEKSDESADSLTDETSETPLKVRRRLQKRGHGQLEATSSSSTSADESSCSRHKRRAASPRRSPSGDARRVRLSIMMKRAVKELPLPYPLKKYVNLGRCFEF